MFVVAVVFVFRFALFCFYFVFFVLASEIVSMYPLNLLSVSEKCIHNFEAAFPNKYFFKRRIKKSSGDFVSSYKSFVLFCLDHSKIFEIMLRVREVC